MAISFTASWQKLKETYSSVDDEQWDQYTKFIRAFGFFATSIVVMRNFGDLMAI